MVKSDAKTVEEYLELLPEERRNVVSTIRALVLNNLPTGYQESINWGTITYSIPLEQYPSTYNGQPLTYLALAAQKNYYSLYLMSVYGDPQQEDWLKERFKQAGKKLDMGKSCLRFHKIEDLPMDVIAKVIARTTPEAFIARYEQLARDRKHSK